MAVTVEFSKPWLPEPGEHDVQIIGVREGESKFGKVLYMDFASLEPGDRGESFTILFGLPRPGRRLTPTSRLGDFLTQAGFPVEEWAKMGRSIDLEELLVGKRLRIVTGTRTKEGKFGPFEAVVIAAVKKVYADGEGPEGLDLPPF